MKNPETKSKKEDATRNTFKKLRGCIYQVYCRRSVRL